MEPVAELAKEMPVAYGIVITLVGLWYAADRVAHYWLRYKEIAAKDRSSLQFKRANDQQTVELAAQMGVMAKHQETTARVHEKILDKLVDIKEDTTITAAVAVRKLG